MMLFSFDENANIGLIFGGSFEEQYAWWTWSSTSSTRVWLC